MQQKLMKKYLKCAFNVTFIAWIFEMGNVLGGTFFIVVYTNSKCLHRFYISMSYFNSAF